MERQTLLRQLDLLRLRFKQSIIPKDIENQRTPVVKLVVERNLAQLKRARNIAMYKLGLAAVLVIIEFLIARFMGLDMGRFMNWNLSNEVDSPVKKKKERRPFFIFMPLVVRGTHRFSI